jgi:hypothetical protein
MTERRNDEPVEGDRDKIERAIEQEQESPGAGVLDESDDDPPEPSEPGI